jgi:hypothetical protein
MKHAPSHPSPVVQAVVDMLHRIGIARVRVQPGRKCFVVWWIGAKRLTARIASAAPRGGDLAHYAAKECERVRKLCGVVPVRAA